MARTSVFFAEDSAGTFDIEGQRIRYSDECEKVFTVGEIAVGMVGNRSFYSELKKEFCENSNKSSEALQEIARRLSCKYPIPESGAGANGETIGLADILMGMMEYGHFVLYQLDSRDNFNIVERRVKPPACAFATTGYKTKEAGEILTRLFYGRDLKDGKNVIKGLKELFEQLACTEIGGTLRISLVNSMGAHIIHQSPIKKPPGVDYFNPAKHSDLIVRNISMIYANQIICTALCALASGDGFTKLVDNGLQVWDNSDPPVKRVHVGQYETGKFAALLRDGEIYGSLFKTGDPDATASYVEISNDGGNGYLKVVGANETTTVQMDAARDTGRIGLYDAEGNECGYLFINSSTMKELLIAGTYSGGVQHGVYLMSAGDHVIVGNNGSSAMSGVQISQIHGDLVPYADGTGNLGYAGRAWNYGKAYTFIHGDLGFVENTCPICGQEFQPGDMLGLFVKAVNDPVLNTSTIPAHIKCIDRPATVSVEQAQIALVRHSLNEDGSVTQEHGIDFDKAETEVFTIGPDYRFDKETGKFYRTLTEDNLKLYTVEEIMAGIEVSPRYAKCTDVISKPIMKTKTITIDINGGANAE
jgi:hypothetical protein